MFHEIIFQQGTDLFGGFSAQVGGSELSISITSGRSVTMIMSLLVSKISAICELTIPVPDPSSTMVREDNKDVA